MISFLQQIRRKTNIILPIALIVASTIIIMRGIFAVPIASDSWLHMGMGRWIIDHKRIPTHIDVSLKQTAPSLEWVSDSWLADILLYVGASSDTTLGAFLILTSILLLTLYIAHEIMNMIGVSRMMRIFVLVLGALSMSVFWKLHPFVFSPVLLLGILYCYISWTTSTSIWALIGMPILVYIFANTSGGFVFLPVGMLTLIVAQSWIERLSAPRSRRSTMRSLWQMWIASIVATLATPNGIRIPIYNVTVLGLLNTRKWFSSLAGTLEATNSSVIKFAPSSTLYLLTLGYIIVLVAAVAYLLVAKRTIAWPKVRPVIATLPFVFLPLIWVRFIPLGVGITLPLFAITLQTLYLTLKKDIPHVVLWGKRISSIGIALLLCYLLFNPIKQISFQPPKEQVDLLIDNELSKAVLVSTDIVGYAYWRLYPDRGYFDAQDYLFDEQDTIAIYSAFNAVSPDAINQLLTTYNMVSVMVSKSNDYLTGYFSTNPDWSMVYFDYNGILFVKNDSVPPNFLHTYKLKTVDFSQDLGFDPKNIDAATKELETFTGRYPHNKLALGQLATLYRHGQQFEKAENALHRIPTSQWDFVVMTEMGRTKAAQGLCKQAEYWFLQALDERNEKNISRTTFDLAILYAICFNDSDKAKHYFKRYTSYPIPDFERQRATVLMQKYVGNLMEDVK
jgi:hypothetical protein